MEKIRGENMIQLLSNNLFHAINTKNMKLLGFLIDEDCLFRNDETKSILGKEKVINNLIESYTNAELSIINGIKDDEDTVLLAYSVKQEEQQQFGSLIVRQNQNKKICYMKNVLIEPITA